MIILDSKTMKKPKICLSVVIPAYNEKNRIIKTLKQVVQYIRCNFINCEIIIVNDGSTDRTAEVIASYISGKKDCKLISLKSNQGKGGAIKSGVLAAKRDWILVMDADSATPIQDVEKLLSQKGNAEVVYGSRYLDRSLLKVHQPLPRRIIGRLGNLAARLVLDINLVDTQCGFKLFSSRAAKKIFSKTAINRWGWDLEVLTIARTQNIKIAEVPVTWRHISGSKFRASHGIWQTFKELFTIRHNLQKGLYR